MTKTIVISGGSSGVGKTTLAQELLRILPGSVHVKIGHHAANPLKKNIYFPMGTRFSAVADRVSKYRFAIIESNSILGEFSPDCAIHLPSENPKPSALLALKKADIVRGNRVTPKTLLALRCRLSLDADVVSRIAWLAGARPSPTTAIILAGGKSSRMGRDKAMLTIEGLPLVDRLIGQLSPWFDKLIVSARTNDFIRRSARTVVDRHPDKGPLAGIEAGLRASRTDANFVVSCDTPNVNMLIVFRLLAELEQCEASVLSFAKNKHEPLFACYRKGVSEIAGSLIEKGQLRASALLETCETRVVQCSERRWFVNLNTPLEYHRYVSTRGKRGRADRRARARHGEPLQKNHETSILE